MAEYIEREAAIEAIMSEPTEAHYPSWYAEKIKAIPAADVAPVVRCKDCKHWKHSWSKAGNSFSDMEYIGGCEFSNYYRRESDFCSYGERKGGDSYDKAD